MVVYTNNGNVLFFSIFSGIVCSLACSIGLVFVQGSGFYWLELFDSFLGTYPLILVGLVESVAVGWILGTERYACSFALK